jgi:hypothetical protein
VIVLGVILILVGYLLPVPGIIATIGWILLVIGLVLLVLGRTGRPVGGRRYWSDSPAVVRIRPRHPLPRGGGPIPLVGGCLNARLTCIFAGYAPTTSQHRGGR